MRNNQLVRGFSPTTPHKLMVGELTYKIILKDYVNAAGRSRLYLQCFKNKSRKLIPLTIEVSPDIWDKTAQECRGRTRDVRDINLQINQIKGRINEILVRARLQNKSLSLEEFNNRFLNPLPEYDFIAYYEYQLIARKDLLAVGTWKNQKSTLAKLKEFKEHIPIVSGYNLTYHAF